MLLGSMSTAYYLSCCCCVICYWVWAPLHAERAAITVPHQYLGTAQQQSASLQPVCTHLHVQEESAAGRSGCCAGPDAWSWVPAAGLVPLPQGNGEPAQALHLLLTGADVVVGTSVRAVSCQEAWVPSSLQQRVTDRVQNKACLKPSIHGDNSCKTHVVRARRHACQLLRVGLARHSGHSLLISGSL
jgi:hypothetical protein